MARLLVAQHGLVGHPVELDGAALALARLVAVPGMGSHCEGQQGAFDRRNFGDVIRNALVNWGYAICDKSVRGWFRPDLPAATDWPMPDGLDRVVIA